MFLADTCIKTNTIIVKENKALKAKNSELKTYLKTLGVIILLEVVRLLII